MAEPRTPDRIGDGQVAFATPFGQTMKPILILFVLALGASACGRQGVNPPDEPAPPVQSPEGMQAVEPAGPSSLANRGSKSFVGRWAANVAWCANPQGERRPVEITPLRFQGYENSCDIARIDEVPGAYVAALACTSEGRTRNERVVLAVSGDMLTLTYPDRDGAVAKLGRCPGSPDPSKDGGGLLGMMKKGED